MLYRIIYNEKNVNILASVDVRLPDPSMIDGIEGLTCGLRASIFDRIKSSICFVPVFKYRDFGVFECQIGVTPNILEFPNEDQKEVKEEVSLLHSLVNSLLNPGEILVTRFNRGQLDFEKSNNLTTPEELCQFMFKLSLASVIRILKESFNTEAKSSVIERLLIATHNKVTRNCLYVTENLKNKLNILVNPKYTTVKINSDTQQRSYFIERINNRTPFMCVKSNSPHLGGNSVITVVEEKKKNKTSFIIYDRVSNHNDIFTEVNYRSIVDWLKYHLPRFPSLDAAYTHFNSIPNSKYSFTKVLGQQDYYETDYAIKTVDELAAQAKELAFRQAGILVDEKDTINQQEVSDLVDSLYEVDKVLWIKQEGNSFVVYTDNLCISEDVITADNVRPTFFGRYKIILKLGKDLVLKFESIQNISYLTNVSNYGGNHPHNTGDTTRYCFGNAADMLQYATNEKNNKLYLSVIMKYLSQANKHDSAGKRYKKWMAEYKGPIYTYVD